MRIFYFCILFPFLSFAQVTHIVNAGMYYYEPANITINQGDIVVWINDGGTHDVNGLTNSITGQPFNNPEDFSSNAISEIGAEIYSHTFNTTGFYNYDCSVYGHASAGMVGTITVNPVEQASIEGVWSFGNDFLHITESELIIFFYSDDLDCLIEIPYSYTSSEPGTITLIDYYYGYSFNIEIFVDNNGDLNILPPEEDVEIWSASTLDINSIVSMVCSTVDYSQMVGKWELNSIDGVNVSESHYMEIFSDGTIIQYDYDVENNCYEITEFTIEFYNEFGEGVVIFDDGSVLDIILLINDSGELVSWVNGQNEVWSISIFDANLFNDCANVSLIDFKEFDASIFPNPAKDNLLVELSHPGQYELVMMDIDGKKIFDGNFKDACNVDVSFLSDGVYLLHVFNSERSIVKTVYIE